MTARDDARAMLNAFQGDRYAFGSHALSQVGPLAARHGNACVIVTNRSEWKEPILSDIHTALAGHGVAVTTEIRGARPNTPVEDVERIAAELLDARPGLIVAIGAGSLIDAVKAAAALATYRTRSDDINVYFGVGKVTDAVRATRIPFPPVIAVQLAASSSTHLTKYANVTHFKTNQKMLIVDDAITPPAAVFDYDVTTTMSADFTADGAFDGMAHSLEVYYGATADRIDDIERIALTGIELILGNVKAAVRNPKDLSAREGLGLGTDLGGYAIMSGGTNGGHLTSFSLVDILPHGRACAIMNPYYTVFFAPAIERQLSRLADIFSTFGYMKTNGSNLSGRDLGKAVAEAMIALSESIGFPRTLGEVDGFSDAHIARALAAAKDPALEMKLKNMPIPMTADMIDDTMGAILDAAKTGDFDKITSAARNQI